MKQWCDACSSGEASRQQVCAYEDLLLVAVVVLAATHQAHSYLLGLLQCACIFFLGVKALIPPGTNKIMYTIISTSFAQLSYDEALAAVYPTVAAVHY